MPDSPVLPAWLTEDDIPAYVEDFALHGEPAFIGAFNWYRNIELLAAFGGAGSTSLRCTWWGGGPRHGHRPA
ncbi:hypothetical protein [Streptomyces sp. NBC_01235]|uniref:hypothetical protein n=1 Tax=Streptomyces sp. NBC_01235 TaxID=2903788 RepID=UPI002E11764C|nr:hypothetical protein OG289_32560 [Streptomyces sp. NBC_01235]